MWSSCGRITAECRNRTLRCNVCWRWWPTFGLFFFYRETKHSAFISPRIQRHFLNSNGVLSLLRPAGRSNLSSAAFHIFRYYNLHVKKGNEDLTVIEKLIHADLKRKKRLFLLPVGKCNIRDAKCSQRHIVFYFSVQPEKKKKACAGNSERNTCFFQHTQPWAEKRDLQLLVSRDYF